MIRTNAYEENDIDMDNTNVTERSSHYNTKVLSPETQNGVQNGSNHHFEWEDVKETEDMGELEILNIIKNRIENKGLTQYGRH